MEECFCSPLDRTLSHTLVRCVRKICKTSNTTVTYRCTNIPKSMYRNGPVNVQKCPVWMYRSGPQYVPKWPCTKLVLPPCWWRSIVVKTAGSAGVLSLSCARLAAGHVTSLWVKRPLSVSQQGRLSLPSLWGRLN